MRPFRRNRRFEDLHRHVSNQTEILTRHLEVFSGTVEGRFAEQWSMLGAHDAELVDLRNRLFDEAETLAEMTVGLERAGARVDQRLGEVEEVLGRLEDLARTLASAAHPARPTRLADLDEATANYLNWAMSYAGLAGEAGSWMNDPCYLEFVPGGRRVRLVNERVVELPYAYSVATGLPEGACVLDVGSAESPLALSLASLGLRATAVDPRGYPFTHPNLTVVTSPIEQWRGPDQPLAAVFCVSTLEHLGVGAYGQPESTSELDREVMDLFGKWLAPDGVLVLTIPVGTRSRTPLERIYDHAQVEDLIRGWTVRDRRYYRRVDDLTWVPADAAQVFTTTRLASGVALMTLSTTS